MAILESLQKLNKNMESFYPAEDYEEASEGYCLSDDNPMNVDVEADINNIAGSGPTEKEDSTSATDIVDYRHQLDINSDEKGPKIIESVATGANKLHLQRISAEQCKLKIKQHFTPENVKVRLPKCEPSIWDPIPGKTRVYDVQLQSTQAMLLSSIKCQLKVAESLQTTKANKETITTCMDGITLSMTANYELNQRRREAIKPQFRSEFAKALCSSSNPADEFLFGGDTSKRVKEVAE
ncbi:predicted protein [Nematostella vectensis]|uniref:Uncharacterized protein n=1 Tax=Nematostella vectensis TaxID=45351 RepID=A7SRR2_NEMVE|nr:uncharacterized protein LOC125561987 [Nematostella vectensis]EDO33597.1 predicted protein [Nematostella vectensis]|eukprot:XP_001625697.1 predicted protein [Nematostella vectensis]